MRILQEDYEEIIKITHKDYNAQYSNNAESEYVGIWNMSDIERMILDLVKEVKCETSRATFWEDKFKKSREIKVYINKWDVNQWIGKYFEDNEYISFDDLIGCIEDLDSEVEHLKEKYKGLEQDLEDNYRPIPVSEQVGISDKDFI